MHSLKLFWTVNLLIDDTANVLLTTQAMLYHVRVAETTEMTGDVSYSKGKINTLLCDLCSVQHPHFPCGLKIGLHKHWENFDFFTDFSHRITWFLDFSHRPLF
jgi:hypothetical protein